MNIERILGDIVDSCSFVTEEWERELMLKSMMEAVAWGRAVSVPVKPAKRKREENYQNGGTLPATDC